MPSLDTASVLPVSIRSPNKLLAALPVNEYERLFPSLRLIPVKFKQVLHKQGERIRDVYFPAGGACSLIKNMHDGRVAEIASIGNEGVIGASAFFGEDVSISDSFVHVTDGDWQTTTVETFKEEMERRGVFYSLLIRYSQALMNQVMQTTACNGLHSAEERACRWLLMTYDRVGQDQFPLTHELMAAMLAVRRPTVTLIVGDLQKSGLIEYRRGYIRIVNREELQTASCECYESVKASYRRLLPEISGSTD